MTQRLLVTGKHVLTLSFSHLCKFKYVTLRPTSSLFLRFIYISRVLIIFFFIYLEILMRQQNLYIKRMWDYQRPWVITWRRGRCWRNWGTSFRRRMNSSGGTRNSMTWWCRRRSSKSNSRKNRSDRWNINQGFQCVIWNEDIYFFLMNCIVVLMLIPISSWRV